MWIAVWPYLKGKIQLQKLAIKNRTNKGRAEKKGSSCIYHLLVKCQKLMCVFVWILAEWLAHENAVFDVAWVPGNSHMVSTIILVTLSNAYLDWKENFDFTSSWPLPVIKWPGYGMWGPESFWAALKVTYAAWSLWPSHHMRKVHKVMDLKCGKVAAKTRYTAPNSLQTWKSLSFKYVDVFCTGARDGNIMVWDTRCSKKGYVFPLTIFSY